MNGTNVLIKVQPNRIANNTIYTQITNLPAGKYTVSLYDINGKYITQTTYQHINSQFKWQLPVAINNGTYLLKWTGNNINLTSKIVVE
jgi:hypothetical protein